jgi:hypothetical protein
MQDRVMQDRSARMTTRAARSWLSHRLHDVPDSLRARMRSAISRESHEVETVSGALLNAAMSCMDEALALGNARVAAGQLLAADALLTAACEAAAENGDAVAFAERACIALAERLDGAE